MISKPDIYTDFQGFSELRKDAQQNSPEAIKKVAKQFESLFVQMMLKSMRDSLPESELFSSNQQRVYQDMFDKQISLNVANGEGVGLAAVIERQLSPPQAPTEPGRSIGEYMNAPVPTRAAVARWFAIDNPYENRPATIENSSTGWQQADDFIKDTWPHAVRAANELGVAPEVLVAQSALETGWGRHMRSMPDGSNSYAMFGIKADARWQGKTVTVSTLEYRDGAMQRERAQFRAYDSLGEAFADYVAFIKSNPRYQRALEHGFDPEAYSRELQRAGYATDPDYAGKINRIQNSELLKTRVSALKNDAQPPLS